MTDEALARLITAAIDEDLGPHGDRTAGLLPEPQRPVVARVTLRQPGVACGASVAAAVCEAFSRRLRQPLAFAAHFRGSAAESTLRAAGAVFGELRGAHAAVLTAERTVLNFLTRLGGVATLTRRYVDAARTANPAVRIYDTRKTVPGWRALDKYAVRCGGGCNHRTGLYDAVLIKDNHIAGIPPERLAGRLQEMLRALTGTTAGRPAPAFIEVEVDALAQLDAVLTVPGVDLILLDNFTPADLAEAVRRRAAVARGRIELEASGGVTLDTVAAIAATGVDRISVGALTHSAPALDLGLDL